MQLLSHLTAIAVLSQASILARPLPKKRTSRNSQDPETAPHGIRLSASQVAVRKQSSAAEVSST